MMPGTMLGTMLGTMPDRDVRIRMRNVGEPRA